MTVRIAPKDYYAAIAAVTILKPLVSVIHSSKYINIQPKLGRCKGERSLFVLEEQQEVPRVKHNKIKAADDRP